MQGSRQGAWLGRCVFGSDSLMRHDAREAARIQGEGLRALLPVE